MYSPNREGVCHVSIIVCTRDRANELAKTFASISRVSVPSDIVCELIVVDNGSVDGTREVVTKCQLPNIEVRYISEFRRGKGFAYNTAMAVARGEVFLFTDDDVLVPTNWIEGMCRPILCREADAVAGGVRIAPHLERTWMHPIQKAALASTEGFDHVSPGVMIGANMAFSRRVLSRVPAFDPELGPGALGFGDETLFSWQLLEAGFRLISRFEVVAEHHFEETRLSRAELIADAKKHGRAGAYMEYHWNHRRIRFPRFQYLKSILSIVCWRLKKRRFVVPDDQVLWWERSTVVRAEFFKSWLEESKRERNYDRRGLVKLRGVRFTYKPSVHNAQFTAS